MSSTEVCRCLCRDAAHRSAVRFTRPLLIVVVTVSGFVIGCQDETTTTSQARPSAMPNPMSISASPETSGQRYNVPIQVESNPSRPVIVQPAPLGNPNSNR